MTRLTKSMSDKKRIGVLTPHHICIEIASLIENDRPILLVYMSLKACKQFF